MQLILKPDKLLISSRNRDKIREIKELMQELSIEVLSLDDIDRELPEVVEDGVTLEENARKKAKQIALLTGFPTVADDTGLFVSALNDQPGVYSARYAGENCSYGDNREKLLSELKSFGETAQRQAEFRTVALLFFPSGDEVIAEGVVKGFITLAERGERGFGYDSIFQPFSSEKTFAEINDEEKNRISHRALAFEALKCRLRDTLER